MAKPNHQKEASPQDDAQAPSRRKTLLFTTTKSFQMEQTTKGERYAPTGLYRCTLEPDNVLDVYDDDDNEPPLQQAATLLADARNFYGGETHHSELVLRNLQFDLASLRQRSLTGNHNAPTKKKNYLYANSHIVRGVDWEIVRAELPQKENSDSQAVLNDDGTLEFRYVFRSRESMSYNEGCGLSCCRPEEEGLPSERRQYQRVVLRSFAVDEPTGDVFVSWEGYYRDCHRADDRQPRWTIGVSRLRTDDPECAPEGVDDGTFRREGHFARCSDPVAVVVRGGTTRDDKEVVLPNGGFAVVPALAGNQRVFVLSVLARTDAGGDPGGGRVWARVWAVPEGSHAQDLGGTVVDEGFMEANTWDGGTLRLHYDSATGEPDHLCRTVFDAGIECFPVALVGSSMVRSSSAQSFLSSFQVHEFCRQGDRTTVSGLDVEWNLEGRPERVYFGCWAGGGAHGNFGSVEADGANLRQVVPGALAGSVLFLPSELEGTLEDFRRESPLGSSNTSLGVDAILGLLGVALVVAAVVRRKTQRPPTAVERAPDWRASYVELPTMDDSPTSKGVVAS